MNEQTFVIKMRIEELIQKKALFKDIIEKDLKKFRILGKTPPIEFKDYNEIKKEDIPKEIENHQACTCFHFATYTFLDKSGEKILSYFKPFIKDITIYIHYFPPIDCLEYIAHHEVSHIIRHVIFSKYEEDTPKDLHDRVFDDINRSLNNNQKIAEICKKCPYANKTVFVEIIDENNNKNEVDTYVK